MKTKTIGCGKYDKKHPELTRSCGDILFSNKVWICDDCRKKSYTKEQMAIISEVENKKYKYICLCGEKVIKMFRYTTVKCPKCGRNVRRKKL